VNELMRRILESKRETRRRLATLSFAEKIEMLEKLRQRRRLISSSALRQAGRPLA